MKKILIAVLLLFVLIPSVSGALVISDGQKSIGLKDLKITFLNQDPDPVAPGEEVEVRFRAENMGQYRIEDIEFEILPEYPFELLSEDEEGAKINIGSLDPAQRGKDSAIFHWKLRVDSEAIEGNNEIELRYFVEGRPAAIKLEPFLVNVKSRDELGKLAGSFNHMVHDLSLKERYRSLLDKVVSADIAEEMLKGDIVLGGENRRVTTLFADIRGFTPLTEGMEPQEVILMLNEYMDRAASAVEEHGGVVDKYVGDEIMAIFGAPVSQEEDALNAVRAALELESISS